MNISALLLVLTVPVSQIAGCFPEERASVGGTVVEVRVIQEEKNLPKESAAGNAVGGALVGAALFGAPALGAVAGAASADDAVATVKEIVGCTIFIRPDTATIQFSEKPLEVGETVMSFTALKSSYDIDWNERALSCALMKAGDRVRLYMTQSSVQLEDGDRRVKTGFRWGRAPAVQ